MKRHEKFSYLDGIVDKHSGSDTYVKVKNSIVRASLVPVGLVNSLVTD